MDEFEDYAIKKVAKGSLIIFAGIVLSSAAFLAYRIIAARYLGPADYGLLTLGITIMNIAAIIGLAGIHHSIGKFISHYLAKKQYDKVKGTLISSLIITLSLSIAILLLLYYSSDFIASSIFKIKGLGPIIAIFSIGVPFSIFTQLLKYYFYAFKKSEYVIISESFFEKMLNLIFLVIVIYISASLYFLSWTYILALMVSSIVAALLLRLNIGAMLKREKKILFNFKQLLFFSLPLMITGILGAALAWTDIIFIGVFKSDADVGIYSTAYALASSLIIFWMSIGDIFYPIISELYAKKSKKAIKNTFEAASRWVFILIFPILVFVLAFPTRTLSLVFGQAYLDASLPLAILIIGYFFTSFFGLAEQGLRTFKKTTFLGISTTLAFAGNILLNLILIPMYGIIGAAIATTITLLAVNSTKFFVFKRILRFSHNMRLYIKYTLSGIISLAIVFYTFRIMDLFGTFHFLSAIIIYFMLYYLFLVVSKAFSKEDVKVLEAFERKSGIRLHFVKRFIK